MLVISFMISQHVTRPLKTIAAAAKEFAGGNFDVRVPEDNRCYETDELAVSVNNMARDLDQLEELTRGFISNVSHEIKTPMTTIGGFVDGILDGTGITLAAPLDENAPVPSCRNADAPYHEGQYVLTVDGFLVSDNVTVTDSGVVNLAFAYSDHNPVEMRFVQEK